MNKPPGETLKRGRNRSWLLVKFAWTQMPQELSISHDFLGQDAQVFQARPKKWSTREISK